MLDTLSIVAVSFKIKDTTLLAPYQLLAEEGLLVWKNRKKIPDSVQVSFETFPFLLNFLNF